MPVNNAQMPSVLRCATVGVSVGGGGGFWSQSLSAGSFLLMFSPFSDLNFLI